MGTKKPDFVFRILLIGENEVGKTSILRRLRDNEFSDTYEQSNPMNVTRHTMEVDGKTVLLGLVDKSINEFVTRTFAHFKRISALLIVYDVTNQESFGAVPRYVNEVKIAVSENIPMLIVGNKIDLEEHRTVEYTTGKELADESGYEYIETSAKTTTNINEMFLKLVRDMIEKEKLKTKKPETSLLRNEGPTTQQQPEKKSSFCSVL